MSRNNALQSRSCIPYDPVSGLSALVSGRQESIPAPGRRSPADKDVCTYCQSRYGFDYYVQPAAAHRDTTPSKGKNLCLCI